MTNQFSDLPDCVWFVMELELHWSDEDPFNEFLYLLTDGCCVI